MYEYTKKYEKYPFLKSQIRDQKNLLLNIVRSIGFYFSEIETLPSVSNCKLSLADKTEVAK